MIELKHVSFSVPEELSNETISIIRDISLKIDERFVAFTGPNGGGKSTLAKIIAGIYVPDSGRILFNGQDITDLSVTERSRLGITYAFQQPVRFKGITVGDLVSLASGKKASVSDVCKYLSEVGLCARNYVNREMNESLSGGELKRIEIAMAMARGTAFTMFDEPEAGIDLWSFQNLIEVFRKMYNRQGGSILIISHQERILSIADRIIVISGGEVVGDGSRDKILPGLLNETSGDNCSFLNSKIQGGV
ncbi:MAG: ATP-binding cassette domain-containing protein [Clostridia bacterium]|nr:ATP-binding cassette domain-containing protein [Clostridia bacterium]